MSEANVFFTSNSQRLKNTFRFLLLYSDSVGVKRSGLRHCLVAETASLISVNCLLALPLARFLPKMQVCELFKIERLYLSHFIFAIHFHVFVFLVLIVRLLVYIITESRLSAVLLVLFLFTYFKV